MTLDDFKEWLEARATRNDDGCLVWKLALREGCPQANWIDRETGKKTTMNVRRAVWTARVGRPPRKSHVIVCSCGTDSCVEPSHLKELSRSQLQKGKRLSASHRLAITMASRERSNIKLSQEQVREVRYGDEPAPQVAARLGISKSHVYAIRRHRWCREVENNPFAALWGGA